MHISFSKVALFVLANINVSTYDMVSWVLLHNSNYVNAKPDKTYTITINN